MSEMTNCRVVVEVAVLTEGLLLHRGLQDGLCKSDRCVFPRLLLGALWACALYHLLRAAFLIISTVRVWVWIIICSENLSYS